MNIPKTLERQSLMDNPERQTTQGTSHRTKINQSKNTTQKNRKMRNKNPTKSPSVNPGGCEGY